MRDVDKARALAILPTGAVEAHGPHLPLTTDGIIAEAMAQAGGARLAARGFDVFLLPTLPFTAAGFAAAFPGTISVQPCTVTAAVVDVAESLARHGIRVLALANAHLDPAHRAALHETVAEGRRRGSFRIVYPDVTRKPWALRLGEEFRSGACHAGSYESSVVMALRPDLVREEVRRGLGANRSSLSDAIRQGKTSFAEAGGSEAYFGDPAAASGEEGRATIETLGAILEEAVLAESTAGGGAEAAARDAAVT